MKRLHLIYIYTVCALFLFSNSQCTDDTDDISDTDVTEQTYIRRTIIAYITADNNLSNALQADIDEMKIGSSSLSDDCRLIIFADHLRKGSSDGTPYIALVKNGKTTIVKQFDHDFYSTSADSMHSVMQWIVNEYPAEEYALIMTGHGSGSVVQKDTLETSFKKLYAYGYDPISKDAANATTYWINIPSIAAALSHLKDTANNALHFEYIFFDCCSMQTAEVAYELRKYTDYIIAPAGEVPADGAPYKHIVPLLGTESSNISHELIDAYTSKTNWKGYGGIAISSVKTSEMENLMLATRKALHSIHTDDRLILNHDKCIYYYRGDETYDRPVLYDIKNLMLNNLPTDIYEEWLQQLEKTVVYKYTPTNNNHQYWYTGIGINQYDFELTANNYGGMGMIAPNSIYDDSETTTIPTPSLNKLMFTLEWTNAIGWHELGW